MKYATGPRLKKVAEEFFNGNVSELARNLEMKPQALSKYVKGESMPGGLILIRLHNVGVNINWFLTGKGEMVLRNAGSNVSEPIGNYLAQLEDELLKTNDKEKVNELLSFSEVIKELDISSSLQRALLLVYTRHMVEDGNEKSTE